MGTTQPPLRGVKDVRLEFRTRTRGGKVRAPEGDDREAPRGQGDQQGAALHLAACHIAA